MAINKLKTFVSDLSGLTVKPTIFSCYGQDAATATGAIALTSFDAKMGIDDTSDMFYGCAALTTFKGDLPNVTNTSNMFYGTNLGSFTGNMPKLINGDNMFNGC